MSFVAMDHGTTPPTPRELRCTANGELLVAGGASGTAGGAVTIADGADAAGGAINQAAAAWYTSVASRLQLLRLLIAAICDAGSHIYTYDTSGNLTADAWTLLGTTRTKTYTYNNGFLTAESDWV